MNLESLDWEVLDRLRATFLSAERAAGPYWHTVTDLDCYDRTYGERIGWKWDAVLRELAARGWRPPAGVPLLDWGCGSGIAGRRVLAAYGAAAFAGLVLHDHSPLALDFATHRAQADFPGLPLARASTALLRGGDPLGLLVLSHVVNELDARARAALAELLPRAAAVLWVEPGTHEASRALGQWRETARGLGFRVVAPCPHAGPCGVLAPGQERHWCHFFAPPPKGIHADSDWVRFGQRAGIDLRALPYSFLVLDRTTPPPTPGGARILGSPRLYKGYAKLFTCTADDVRERSLQQRDAPAFFKSLKRDEISPLQAWQVAGDRILPRDS